MSEQTTQDTDGLRCEELVEIVTDYLEGALTDPQRDRFEAHLATCEGCQTYVKQLRQLVEATGNLSQEMLPNEAVDELLEAFRDWRQG